MTSSVTLPITFRALGNEDLAASLTLVHKTVTSLADDEALIRVAYSALNKMDPHLQHTNLFNLPMPLVLGFDFSGTVAAVGGGEDQKVKVGSEVFGYTVGGGCLAEYVVVKKENAIVREGNIPLAEACTLGVAYGSAYEPVEVTGQLSKQKGKTVFIPGGAGGVGHFAVQLCKMYGLTVISSGGKPASLDLLHKMGVDHVIDYSQQDVVKEVLSLTKGQGVDFVYDSTYQPSSYRQSAQVVKSGGRWIRLGPWAHTPDSEQEVTELVKSRGAEVVIGDMDRYTHTLPYMRQREVLYQAMRDAAGWYEAGKLKPYLSSIVPFEVDAVQAALDGIMQGKINVGKVVVKVQS
jgi:NADPH:quinone reductase-like Zn-dependent oxidoreductase